MSSEDPFKVIIYKIWKNQPLTVNDAETAFSLIMSGSVTNSQIGAFLMGLKLIVQRNMLTFVTEYQDMEMSMLLKV